MNSRLPDPRLNLIYRSAGPAFTSSLLISVAAYLAVHDPTGTCRRPATPVGSGRRPPAAAKPNSTFWLIGTLAGRRTSRPQQGPVPLPGHYPGRIDLAATPPGVTDRGLCGVGQILSALLRGLGHQGATTAPTVNDTGSTTTTPLIEPDEGTRMTASAHHRDRGSTRVSAPICRNSTKTRNLGSGTVYDLSSGP